MTRLLRQVLGASAIIRAVGCLRPAELAAGSSPHRQTPITIYDVYNGLGLFREFFGRCNGFDISRKGDGIENGPIYTLAGEMPRVPATYEEVMR